MKQQRLIPVFMSDREEQRHPDHCCGEHQHAHERLWYHRHWYDATCADQLRDDNSRSSTLSSPGKPEPFAAPPEQSQPPGVLPAAARAVSPSIAGGSGGAGMSLRCFAVMARNTSVRAGLPFNAMHPEHRSEAPVRGSVSVKQQPKQVEVASVAIEIPAASAPPVRLSIASSSR